MNRFLTPPVFDLHKEHGTITAAPGLEGGATTPNKGDAAATDDKKQALAAAAAASAKEKHDHDHTNYFPDQVIRKIVKYGGIPILASRLAKSEDEACEALRGLGSLATLAEARSEIYGTCGSAATKLLSSSRPMLARQSARLLQNLK